MTSADWMGLAAVAVLILLAAIMAAAEVVITRTSRVHAYRLRVEDQRGAASLVKLVENPAPYLNVVLLLTLLLHLAGAAIARTVGGLVLGTLGHVPTQGEHVELENLRFTGTRIHGRRISETLVEQLGTSEPRHAVS